MQSIVLIPIIRMYDVYKTFSRIILQPFLDSCHCMIVTVRKQTPINTGVTLKYLTKNMGNNILRKFSGNGVD